MPILSQSYDHPVNIMTPLLCHMIGVKRLWGLPEPKTSELLPTLSSLEVVTKLHCKKRSVRFYPRVCIFID